MQYTLSNSDEIDVRICEFGLDSSMEGEDLASECQSPHGRPNLAPLGNAAIADTYLDMRIQGKITSGDLSTEGDA